MTSHPAPSPADALRKALLYHYCRLQFPGVVLSSTHAELHWQRAFRRYLSGAGDEGAWSRFLTGLYPLDWYLAATCLEGVAGAWERLFAARANRADFLLVDALRARAVRLYPRNEERQENAVAEFWSHLLVAETSGSVPVLARYDGQRPLIPWLIRVFQNWHVSQLRHRAGVQPLPEDEVALPLPEESNNTQWRETFCLAARDWLNRATQQDLLILGLRLRYRLSQRDVAHLLGVHEGTISRQTSQLRDRCLEFIGQRLTTEGWSGDDLEGFVLGEMGNLLADEARLSADQLARLLAARGKRLPPAHSEKEL